ncbi:MAG: hypothetical protein WA865_08110, partial [Spirulinaceae cyanobacterium]
SDNQDESYFRDFLVPNLKNTVESANFQHKIGNHDIANYFLQQAKKGLEECIEQNKKDKTEAEGTGEDEEN